VKLLGKVEDSFELPTFIPQYRCVIMFRFLAADGRIRIKDEIQLRTPGGCVKETHVAAFEHVKYLEPDPPKDERPIGICLPPEITKADVPPGTEVWVRDGETKLPGAVVETP
jgi:hypothetical protein